MRCHVMDVEHLVQVSGERIETPRLLLRPWSPDDAPAALAVYGDDDVTRWLSPAMERVTSLTDMADLLSRWESETLEHPQRRWAVELRSDRTLVGSAALRALPPDDEDLEIGWQLAPAYWGKGLGAEAGHAVAHYAFESGVDELFSVVRPRNTRGIGTARRIGMEWVGETEKYYDLRLQVYRLRNGDLDVPTIGS
jgi:RimJ/RimL family protein N-acetyltransferase